MTPLALIRLFREKYSESLFFDISNKVQNWEEAEEKARYDDELEWEDVTDYDDPYDDIEAEEED